MPPGPRSPLRYGRGDKKRCVHTLGGGGDPERSEGSLGGSPSDFSDNTALFSAVGLLPRRRDVVAPDIVVIAAARAHKHQRHQADADEQRESDAEEQREIAAPA